MHLYVGKIINAHEKNYQNMQKCEKILYKYKTVRL